MQKRDVRIQERCGRNKTSRDNMVEFVIQMNQIGLGLSKAVFLFSFLGPIHNFHYFHSFSDDITPWYRTTAYFFETFHFRMLSNFQFYGQERIPQKPVAQSPALEYRPSRGVVRFCGVFFYVESKHFSGGVIRSNHLGAAPVHRTASDMRAGIA